MRNLGLPDDTTIEAARVQAGVWRRMGMEKRLRLAAELIDDARATTEAAIQKRHPEYTARQVRLAGIWLRLGDELFRKAYPGEHVLP
ncbi:MAG TPA: hypothetical protein VFC46_08085 [Humisphaera sp.]|nr:hypothetical protein [Humisphaera sp.]